MAKSWLMAISTLSSKRLGIRIIVCILVCIYLYFYSRKEITNIITGIGSGPINSNTTQSWMNGVDHSAVHEEGEFIYEGDHILSHFPPRSKSDNEHIPRVLLFITTHFSEQHEWYLKTCWPQALATSTLLRNSDVRVYLNTAKTDQRANALHLFNDTFRNQSLTVHVRAHNGTQVSKEEKQKGAMEALTSAHIFHWFDGYDWVIRLNPDVIIRNDTFLVNTIKNDPDAKALLINCFWMESRTRAHTDFFMVKPEALPTYAFLTPNSLNSEYSFTHDVQSILDSGGHRWIREAFPARNRCRAGFERAIESTSITHMHPGVNTSVCPIPFGEN